MGFVIAATPLTVVVFSPAVGYQVSIIVYSVTSSKGWWAGESSHCMFAIRVCVAVPNMIPSVHHMQLPRIGVFLLIIVGLAIVGMSNIALA